MNNDMLLLHKTDNLENHTETYIAT